MISETMAPNRDFNQDSRYLLPGKADRGKQVQILRHRLK